MESIEIQLVTQPVTGTIRPPGSKSLTNRALIVAALAKGTSELTGILESVDTAVMREALQRLGIAVDFAPAAKTARIAGAGGLIPRGNRDLWCENSGTSIRFLTALCALGHGRFRLDGNARMRERPIAPLIDALVGIGVDAKCELNNGCPPVVLHSQGIQGGTIQVGGDLSSQYLSGLLMIAPVADRGLTVQVTGELVSRPYVDMTLQLMREFGATIEEPERNRFQVSPDGYQGRSWDIEPDASAASYFFALAAVTGGRVTVTGLHQGSLQGDLRFVRALERMGCETIWDEGAVTLVGEPLRGIDIDMNDISDTAQTLACVAPFAEGPTRIRNVRHMRLKETDRVAATVNELRKVGLTVDEYEDGLTIHPGPLRPAVIDTYDDHRMAMSFALLGLRSPGIRIADPGCTAKTYPHYFEDLERLCRNAR